MSRFVFVVPETTTYSSPPATPLRLAKSAAGEGRSGRVEYVRKWKGYHLRAIADFFSDGRMDFADQEPGEPGWFPFQPTVEEREFAASLLRRASGETDAS